MLLGVYVAEAHLVGDWRVVDRGGSKARLSMDCLAYPYAADHRYRLCCVVCISFVLMLPVCRATLSTNFRQILEPKHPMQYYTLRQHS
jgi:hypothetical protein